QACETLIAAAVRAPSGDNTQPWRFVVDESQRVIFIELDETRDTTPMNSGQRMARLAIGAAIENMLVAASRLEWQVRLESAPPTAVAAVRIIHASEITGTTTALNTVMTQRVTNRRLYDRQELAPELLEKLPRA